MTVRDRAIDTSGASSSIHLKASTLYVRGLRWTGMLSHPGIFSMGYAVLVIIVGNVMKVIIWKPSAESNS